MARVSFTLRRTTANPDLGSYVRYDPNHTYDTSGPGGVSTTHAFRTDYDSALRADNLQIAPAVFEESFLEANSVCYGEVTLNWGINFSPAGAAPTVTEALIVYSPHGEPQTVAAGQVLVESNVTYAYLHTSLPEGKWAYYSMFVHYESIGGDSYYERVASLGVLAPKEYGSTLDLWNRIPSYYRLQDHLLGKVNDSDCLGKMIPSDGVVGPLFKYLSIIGFDIDRIRTIIDHLMVSHDPALANTATLDALGQQMAAILRTNDLGSQRMRSLMNDIGFFRRSKGTEIGTEYFAKAISNSDIDIDQVNKTITIYSQRVNYITVPKTAAGLVTHRPAGDVEQVEASALPFSDTTYSSYGGSYTYSANSFTTTGSGTGAGVNSVMVHLSSIVPVKLGNTVGFSVHSNVGVQAIKWVRLVDAAGVVLGFSDQPKEVNGVPAFEVTIDTFIEAVPSGNYKNGYVEFLVDLAEVPTFLLKYLLAERNHLGDYFDGDTVRGGWLIDSSSISDYRWSASANASQSIFAEDYERSKSIVDALLFDVLPITEADQYTIVAYNAIRGI